QTTIAAPGAQGSYAVYVILNAKLKTSPTGIRGIEQLKIICICTKTIPWTASTAPAVFCSLIIVKSGHLNIFAGCIYMVIRHNENIFAGAGVVAGKVIQKIRLQ